VTASSVSDASLRGVVDRAVDNVAAGGGPFAALVLRGDEVLAEGVNRVTRDLDPTAHAEVVAIRAACRVINDFTLTGCVLVASCEPCPMCLAASMWARLDEVVYVADRHDAARAGFDDRVFYDLFDQPRSAWPTPVHQAHIVPGQEKQRPFEAWQAKSDRIHY
jgi:guanine deaminase